MNMKPTTAAIATVAAIAGARVARRAIRATALTIRAKAQFEAISVVTGVVGNRWVGDDKDLLAGILQATRDPQGTPGSRQRARGVAKSMDLCSAAHIKAYPEVYSKASVATHSPTEAGRPS